MPLFLSDDRYAEYLNRLEQRYGHKFRDLSKPQMANALMPMVQAIADVDDNGTAVETAWSTAQNDWGCMLPDGLNCKGFDGVELLQLLRLLVQHFSNEIHGLVP